MRTSKLLDSNTISLSSVLNSTEEILSQHRVEFWNLSDKAFCSMKITCLEMMKYRFHIFPRIYIPQRFIFRAIQTQLTLGWAMRMLKVALHLCSSEMMYFSGGLKYGLVRCITDCCFPHSSSVCVTQLSWDTFRGGNCSTGNIQVSSPLINISWNDKYKYIHTVYYNTGC